MDMDPERKPRGDATPLHEHAEDLAKWLLDEGVTYAVAVKRLADEHGVTTSRAALHRWLRRYERVRLRERVLRNITAGAEATRQIRAQAHAHGIPQIDELISWVRVLVANLATRADAAVDVQGLVSLIKPVIDWQKVQQRGQELEMDREKLELLKRKAAMAEAAEQTLGDTSLTPEQKMTRFREVFGIPG
jgi:hypothetical protein